jgi:hypothetical protein
LTLPFLIFLFWSLELLPNFFTLSDTGTESPREPGRDGVGFFVLPLPFLIFIFWSLEILISHVEYLISLFDHILVLKI